MPTILEEVKDSKEKLNWRDHPEPADTFVEGKALEDFDLGRTKLLYQYEPEEFTPKMKELMKQATANIPLLLYVRNQELLQGRYKKDSPSTYTIKEYLQAFKVISEAESADLYLVRVDGTPISEEIGLELFLGHFVDGELSLPTNNPYGVDQEVYEEWLLKLIQPFIQDQERL